MATKSYLVYVDKVIRAVVAQEKGKTVEEHGHRPVLVEATSSQSAIRSAIKQTAEKDGHDSSSLHWHRVGQDQWADGFDWSYATCEELVHEL